MHTATLAELPHLAVGALVFMSPLAITELLEAVLPHLPEAVAVDVALGVVTAHARATRDIAIDTYRGDVNASTTHIEVVAHLGLVAS